MDAVRYWLNIIMEVNRRDHTSPELGAQGDATGPVASARAIGMAMMAMHDAYFGVAGGVPQYRVDKAPSGALNAEVAGAAAARSVLQSVFPDQAAFLGDAWRRFAADTSIDAASETYGNTVGAHIVAWRSGAGDAEHLNDAGKYTEMPGKAYYHDKDPLHAQGYLGVEWGKASSFLPGLAMQELAAPPLPNSPNGTAGFDAKAYYAQEFGEVQSKGKADSTTRTPDEEEIGIFWGYDGMKGVGTPPRLYLQVALTVLDGIAARRGTWLTRAKFLEAVTAIAVAMADAGIQAWFYKYKFLLWRPVVGIRSLTVGAPGTTPDKDWQPLGAPPTNADLTKLALTPPFPAYPSGHATFGAASLEVLRQYIRHNDASYKFTDSAVDDIAFTFQSDEFDGVNKAPQAGAPTGKERLPATRSFPSLWSAIVENSLSRIYLGVHWRFDGISARSPGAVTSATPKSPGEVGPFGGVPLGLKIAREVAKARGFNTPK